MKLKYERAYGKRIKSGGFWWLEYSIGYKFYYQPCHSLKSAMRFIQNSNLPQGTNFTLVHRLVGADIFITK